jgi:hypothetical protein
MELYIVDNKIRQENVSCELSTHAVVHVYATAVVSSSAAVERQLKYHLKRAASHFLCSSLPKLSHHFNEHANYFCAALNLISCHSYSIFLCKNNSFVI